MAFSSCNLYGIQQSMAFYLYVTYANQGLSLSVAYSIVEYSN